MRWGQGWARGRRQAVELRARCHTFRKSGSCPNYSHRTSGRSQWFSKCLFLEFNPCQQYLCVRLFILECKRQRSGSCRKPLKPKPKMTQPNMTLLIQVSTRWRKPADVSIFVLLVVILLLLVGVGQEKALAQADSHERDPDPKISLSAGAIIEVLRREPGLLLEVKRALVRKAYEQERLLDPADLTRSEEHT